MSSLPVFSPSSLAPLRATDVAKAYGDRLVLDGVDLLAHPGQPVGVVGENGVGKSTLLRIVIGQEAADAGSVSLPEDVGLLTQNPEFPPGATVGDVLDVALAPLHDGVRRLESMAARLHDAADGSAADDYAAALEWARHHDAWDADRRAELACARFGLGGIGRDHRVDRLSGGQRSRLALAALIVRQPDCVILDEPTNHLDEQAIDYLESFLTALEGVVVVASHDRVFLDHVCSVIVDLDASHFGVDGDGSNRYTGGFSDYLEHKQLARRRWEQAFLDQQNELNALRRATRTTARSVSPHNRPPRDNDKYIHHFKGENVAGTISRRVRNVEQRIEAIEKELVPKPPRPLSFGRALTGESRHQGLAVSVRRLEVTGRLRLDRIDLAVGEHLLVTGDNGSGKSTLLNVLAGTLAADSGQAIVGARRVGRLAQDVVFRDPEQTPDEVYAAATGSSVAALGELGLLHPRDLGRPVGRLSVGQQRRLALAILVAGEPDLLLLDEPTNHISLLLATELEEALGRSPGTVVIASHDRWLRDRWAGKTLHLSAVEQAR
jgi:macrolide transport system ATP-binding/permease protein